MSIRLFVEVRYHLVFNRFLDIGFDNRSWSELACVLEAYVVDINVFYKPRSLVFSTGVPDLSAF